MGTSDSILILGIGNLLLGDEGIGVHAIQALEKLSFPENVQLLDGGTGGFHLLSHLEGHACVILIDATIDGKPAGTLSVIKPKFSSDFPKTLSAHDIGLKDLVESSALLGHLPKIILITVSIEDLQPMSMSLSPAIEHSIPQVVDTVHSNLQKLLS
ncbi:MAG: hydrogenase maturation protease [SAR324 cluster bacterium]|nr:hydrogenase maturation protease [SAR324 cluster bacterium]